MKENGIENISIQNFKAFQREKRFDIGRNHVLIYGPNGSGKSSLYWALYTLFQSSVKSDDKIEKYFSEADDENLLNINTPDILPFIKIKTKVQNVEREFELNPEGITGDKPNLKELNLSSEFISHRLLINFYNFRNSKEINLYDVFDRDILPFMNGVTYFKDKVLSEVINSISQRVSIMGGREWRTIQRIRENDLTNLNREVKQLVDFINENATKYLEDNFKPNDIQITLTYKGAYQIEERTVNRKKKYSIIPPVYKLSIKNKKANGEWKDIERPQSFLNEARLTKIGIAIRFCLLPKRPVIPLRILALDDMLISLDLDNRLNLIRTILSLYKDDYQIFIFTHEKGFFNEVKRNINDELDNWRIFEFQAVENQNVRFKSSKNEIQKAKSFLENSEFENCALELRKLGEIIFKNYIEKNKPDYFKTKKFVSFSNMLNEATNIISQSTLSKFQKNILELNLSAEEWELVKSEEFDSIRKSPEIDQEIKKRIFKARDALFVTVESVKLETFEALKYVKEVREIKDRLLNYGAHPSDDTLFKTEMKEAIELFDKLHSVLNKV